MTTERQFVCNYALLRFLPYPETGEFVNVGVVAHCGQARLLDSRLARSNDQRVAQFFPDLDLGQYHWARDLMAAEIDRIQKATAAPDAESERGRALFLELVRPRESTLRFDEIRTILTPHPEQIAAELFAHYVSRFEKEPRAREPDEVLTAVA